MATETDLEKEEQQEDEAAEPEEQSSAASDETDASDEGDVPAKPTSIVAKSASRAEDDAADEDVDVVAPTQLGTKRFVYAAYFGGAICIAFIMSKILGYAWFRIGTMKPAIGEPNDEIVVLVSAAIGAACAFYYWKRTRARKLAEEVADELAKVTWPNKEEVTNSTIVTIVVTLLSTVFFFLMDRFWGFVTNLVYGT